MLNTEKIDQQKFDFVNESIISERFKSEQKSGAMMEKPLVVIPAKTGGVQPIKTTLDIGKEPQNLFTSRLDRLIPERKPNLLQPSKKEEIDKGNEFEKRLEALRSQVGIPKTFAKTAPLKPILRPAKVDRNNFIYAKETPPMKSGFKVEGKKEPSLLEKLRQKKIGEKDENGFNLQKIKFNTLKKKLINLFNEKIQETMDASEKKEIQDAKKSISEYEYSQENLDMLNDLYEEALKISDSTETIESDDFESDENSEDEYEID